MKLIKDIAVILPDKSVVKTDVEIYSRGGSKSPKLEIILYDGKRYPPYAQKIRNIYFTLNALFTLTYGDAIQDLVRKDGGFMSCISKDAPGWSLYHTPVVLGKDHGVV